MRKVLLIVNEFPPMGGGGVMRAAKFAKYLPAHGWQPIVLACDYHGNLAVVDEALHREVLDAGVRIVPVPSLDPNRLKRWVKTRLGGAAAVAAGSAPGAVRIGRLGALKRRLEDAWLFPDRHVLWHWPAVRAAHRLLKEEGLDTVLTTSPPPSTHLIGLELKRARPELRWVADFRDLWSLSPEVEGGDARQRRRHQRLEGLVLASADQAIFVSAPILERTRERFDLGTRGKVITNGFDRADFAHLDAPPAACFTVSYVGSIFGVRTRNALVEGLERFVEQERPAPGAFCMRFVGAFDPAYRAKFTPLAAAGYLEELPFVPHHEALRLMGGSHLLVLVLPDCDESRMAYTGKFFEYLAAGRPLLALTPAGPVSEVVEELGMGQVVAPDDPVAIALALAAAYRRYRELGSLPSLSSEQLDRFDRRRLTGELAQLLERGRA